MTSTKTSPLIEKLNWRYATKKFDPSKKLSDDQWNDLKQALILTPSSYGLQPYKFIVITDSAIKEKLVPLSWKQTQPKDCSHYVVFAGLRKMSEDYVAKFIDLTAKTTGTPAESLAGFGKVIIKDVVHGPRGQKADQWAALQAYIALGNLMTAAAMINVDACPMEGIQPDGYDEALNLKDSPYHTLVACALGFRASDDKYAARKKVRFSESDLIEIR